MAFLDELDRRLAKYCEKLGEDYDPSILHQDDYGPLSHSAAQWWFFGDLLQELPITVRVDPPYAMVFQALDPGYHEPELYDAWHMIETVDASLFPDEAAALFEEAVFLRTDEDFENGDPSTMTTVVLSTGHHGVTSDTGERQLHLVTSDSVETFSNPLELLDAVLRTT